MDGKRITRLLGVGIRDIKTLDVGDMGYANGWYMYHGWYNSELPKFLMQLCEEHGGEENGIATITILTMNTTSLMMLIVLDNNKY